MDHRAARMAFALSDTEEYESPRRGAFIYLFVALSCVVALVLLMARAAPAWASGGTVAVAGLDDDDDDDDDDGTDDGTGDGDTGTVGDNATADDTVTGQGVDDETVTVATVDATADTAQTDDTVTVATVDTTADDTTLTGETTVGGTTIGDDTADDTTTGDTIEEFAGLLPDEEVLGSRLSRGAPADVLGAAQVRGAQVAAGAAEDGEGVLREGVLPFTGGQIASLVGAALGLIGAGGLLAKRRRG